MINITSDLGTVAITVIVAMCMIYLIKDAIAFHDEWKNSEEDEDNEQP